MKKFSKILGKIFSYSIIALSVYMLLGVAIQKDEFYVFGYRPVLVLSGSMEPYMESATFATRYRVRHAFEKFWNFCVFENMRMRCL